MDTQAQPTQEKLFDGTEIPQIPSKAPKGIDHRKTIELYKKGLGAPTIAKIQGCNTSNITHALQRYGVTEHNVKTYKDFRADILAGLQDKLLSSITEQDVQKAPLGSKVLAVAQLYDKERLERGLATEQISVNAIVQDHADIGDEIAKLEAKLAALMGDKP